MTCHRFGQIKRDGEDAENAEGDQKHDDTVENSTGQLAVLSRLDDFKNLLFYLAVHIRTFG
jgi:hypothetical protein